MRSCWLWFVFVMTWQNDVTVNTLIPTMNPNTLSVQDDIRIHCRFDEVQGLDAFVFNFKRIKLFCGNCTILESRKCLLSRGEFLHCSSYLISAANMEIWRLFTNCTRIQAKLIWFPSSETDSEWVAELHNIVILSVSLPTYWSEIQSSHILVLEKVRKRDKNAEI